MAFYDRGLAASKTDGPARRRLRRLPAGGTSLRRGPGPVRPRLGVRAVVHGAPERRESGRWRAGCSRRHRPRISRPTGRAEELRHRLDLRRQLALVGEEVKGWLRYVAAGGVGTRRRRRSPQTWPRIAAFLLACANIVSLVSALAYDTVGWMVRAVGPGVDRVHDALAPAGVAGDRSVEPHRRIIFTSSPKCSPSSSAGRRLAAASGDLVARRGRRTARVEAHPRAADAGQLLRVAQQPVLRAHLALLLWGTQLAWAIERGGRATVRTSAQWVAGVGEFEALTSLVVIRMRHPSDPFPAIVERGPAFDGEGLAHPLIASARVWQRCAADAGTRVLVVSDRTCRARARCSERSASRRCSPRLALPCARGACRSRRWRSARRCACGLAAGGHIAVLRRNHAAQGDRRSTSGRCRCCSCSTSCSRARTRTTAASGRPPSHQGPRRARRHRPGDDARSGAGRTDVDAWGRGAERALPRNVRRRRIHFDRYTMRPGVVQTSNALELMRAIGSVSAGAWRNPSFSSMPHLVWHPRRRRTAKARPHLSASAPYACYGVAPGTPRPRSGRYAHDRQHLEQALAAGRRRACASIALTRTPSGVGCSSQHHRVDVDRHAAPVHCPWWTTASRDRCRRVDVDGTSCVHRASA